ncbi:hypothetical protein QFC22_002555 [Naganishia vaughanmartiniae]|uniref:Uncharacterized protein n=1 Tax=Naganishia vaughanmartiniae TaxID=1424756 RepID=A0ACC2XC22_9TREE|nr:hypothetical protein QFC22_002555 [Naganishia vaughanmartiniae]
MSELFLHDQGLDGVEGAQIVLNSIARDIAELSIGHNRLGTSGCNYLFQALTAAKAGEDSPAYQRISTAVTVPRRLAGFKGLKKITLSANGIDEQALESIGEYLTGDDELRELYFTNNLISGPENLRAFGKAVSRSKLEVISFNTNPLSSVGLDEFLEGLAETGRGDVEQNQSREQQQRDRQQRTERQPPSRSQSRSRWPSSPTATQGHRLKQLHLSSCPLGIEGARIIADFISHPERSANLNVITLNDCELGLRGLNIVTRAAEMWNFTLLVMETHLNFTISSDIDPYQRIMQGSSFSPALQEELDALAEDERVVDQGITFATNTRLDRTRYRRPSFPLDKERYSLARLLEMIGNASTTAAETTQQPTDGSATPDISTSEGIRRGLRYRLSARESEIIRRNSAIRERGQKTALQALPVARVLLTARLPNPSDVGAEIMNSLMQNTALQPPTISSSTSGSQTPRDEVPSPHQRFPLMDLPFDVIPNIIQQSTDCPDALSDYQWESLYRYAEVPETLQAEIQKLASSRVGRRETFVISTNPNMAIMGSGLSNLRPGPGHPGRSDWLKSLAFGLTTQGKLIPQEEKAVIINILEEVGCNTWDWREQPEQT